MYETIIVEKFDHYKIIYLNRPNVFNAMNMKMIEELIAEFEISKLDEICYPIIITGVGDKAFSAGADIDEMRFDIPQDVLEKTKRWVYLFKLIETISQPVIAAVNGYAPAGGTELSLACDYVITNKKSRFGLAEINIGVMPGAGAIVRITRWLGRARAKEILMTGKMISAEQAFEWGLSNELLEGGNDNVLERAKEVAREFSGKSLRALGAIKNSINVAEEIPYNTAIDLIMRDFSLLFDTPDQREGMSAFVEKRKPVFAKS